MSARSMHYAVMIAVPSVAFAQDNGSADAGYMQAMKSMMDKTHSMKMTGDADKDFVMMMIPHHQAAIEMAKVQLRSGKDPKIKKLAEDIIKAQEKEIAEMKEWQSKH